LKPSIILFSCIAHQLGLASIAKLTPGSHHTCHQVGSWSLSTQHFFCSVFSRSDCPTRISPWSSFIYFLHYTPLSSIISDIAVGSRMYADDNQLSSFLSPLNCEFSTKMWRLQATVNRVSQWMSSNLWLLDQSKTEFLLIGLPAQLPKISYPSLLKPYNAIIAPTSSARKLGSSLILHSMSDHISSFSKSCFLPIRDLRKV